MGKCAKGEAFECPAAKLYKSYAFYSFCMYIMHFNLACN